MSRKYTLHIREGSNWTQFADTLREVAGGADFELKISDCVSVDEFVLEPKSIKKLTPKELEILDYCYPNFQYMWAAVIMGMILECDFRDAKQVYETYNMKRIYENIRG